jgi:hypothetical protein
MDKKALLKGYQFLENDFFNLCQTRGIGRIPMLLYVYLRGLYCRFQKPVFTWADKQIMEHLGISRSTLNRSRKHLQVRGVISYQSGKGKVPTQYTMLGSVLLPVFKMKRECAQNQAEGSRQFDNSLPLSIKEILLKKAINGRRLI